MIGDAVEVPTQDLDDAVALAPGFNRRELAKEVLDSSGSRHLQTRNGPVEIPDALARPVVTWLQRRGGAGTKRLPAWPAGASPSLVASTPTAWLTSQRRRLRAYYLTPT